MESPIIKELTKVESYSLPNGKLCAPGIKLEFTKAEWNSIPEYEKVLFVDFVEQQAEENKEVTNA
jgi:hypothetical protein